MKQVVLIHGCYSKDILESEKDTLTSEREWFPWLKAQLESKGYTCETPEFPSPDKPMYQAWKEVFEQIPISEETILVGYSCGAGFVLRWLGETSQKVVKLVLISPFFDPETWDTSRDLVNFKLKKDLPEGIDIHIFYSSDDPWSGVHTSFKELARLYPDATQHLHEHKGHFSHEDLGSKEFNELLDVILK